MTIALRGGYVDPGYNYQTPATGGSITMANSDAHLVLAPSGTLATLTITMCANPFNGQFVNIRSSQTITALTVSPNSGQSVSNAPSTLVPGTHANAIYRLANTTWYF